MLIGIFANWQIITTAKIQYLFQTMIQLITYNNLNKHAGSIVHFTTTRQGGVSAGEYNSLNLGLYTSDNPQNIETNRKILCDTLGIASAQLITACQTHGTSIKHIDHKHLNLTPGEQKAALQGYDALVCNIPQICITATTADCVPILLYDTRNNAIASIHSGWRSTLSNISQQTITYMQQHFGTQPVNLVASIGACISRQMYEVGHDLYSQFTRKDFDMDIIFSYLKAGKYLFDIRKTVYLQLQQAGVSDIEVSNHCTFSDEDLFFSARRQGTASGRMLSGIMLST